MKFSLSTILIGILPFIVALFCFVKKFNIDTGPMLNLFLPLVWGILFALGGGIVYLNNHKFDSQKLPGKILSKLSAHTKSFSLILIGHCLLFISISIFYPVRFFIQTTFKISPGTFEILRLLGDCLLFSTIMVPALFSLVVGAFCLFISFNQHHLKK